MSTSLRFQKSFQKSASCPALERRSRTISTLLVAVGIAVSAGLPVAAGFHDPNHVLTAPACTKTLASAAPANNTDDFDWQSVSRPPMRSFQLSYQPETDCQCSLPRSLPPAISSGPPALTATNAPASFSRSITTLTAHPTRRPPSRCA